MCQDSKPEVSVTSKVAWADSTACSIVNLQIYYNYTKSQASCAEMLNLTGCTCHRCGEEDQRCTGARSLKHSCPVHIWNRLKPLWVAAPHWHEWAQLEEFYADSESSVQRYRGFFRSRTLKLTSWHSAQVQRLFWNFHSQEKYPSVMKPVSALKMTEFKYCYTMTEAVYQQRLSTLAAAPAVNTHYEEHQGAGGPG